MAENNANTGTERSALCFANCFCRICPCCWCGAFQVVRAFEEGILFTLGRVDHKPLPAGIHCINPMVQELLLIDKRTRSIDVPQQTIMTKDTVCATIDCIVYIRVKDALKAVLEVQAYTRSTYDLASSMIRGVMGRHTLDEILRERIKIATELATELQGPTDKWGITVERVEIRSVTIPQSMQRAMATEAESDREKAAQIIDAQAEFEASATLAEAAKVLSSQKGTLQLRYLQTLSNIATEQKSTTFFPIPMRMGEGIIADPENQN